MKRSLYRGNIPRALISQLSVCYHYSMIVTAITPCVPSDAGSKTSSTDIAVNIIMHLMLGGRLWLFCVQACTSRCTWYRGLAGRERFTDGLTNHCPVQPLPPAPSLRSINKHSLQSQCSFRLAFAVVLVSVLPLTIWHAALLLITDCYFLLNLWPVPVLFQLWFFSYSYTV